MPRHPDLPCAQCGALMWRSVTSLPQGQATCRACRTPTPLTRPCAECGVQFTNKNRAVRHCSKQCSGQAKRKQPIPCPICGTMFVPWKTTTCGRACGKAWRMQKEPDWGRGRKPRVYPKPTSCTVHFPTCLECGVVFCTRSLNASLCSTPCRKKRQVRVTLARYHSDTEFRDEVLARAHARRADKLGLGNARVTLSYVGDRDGWRCGLCGRKVNPDGKGPRRPSLDHVIPLSRGGDHSLANVQISHYFCNLSKHNRGGGEQLALFG